MLKYIYFFDQMSSNKNIIRIWLRSFDSNTLDKATSNLFRDLRKVTKVLSVIALPNRKYTGAVNAGPHIDKRAMDKFQLIKYKRMIDVEGLTPQGLEQINSDVPAGVDIEIKHLT